MFVCPHLTCFIQETEQDTIQNNTYYSRLKQRLGHLAYVLYKAQGK